MATSGCSKSASPFSRFLLLEYFACGVALVHVIVCLISVIVHSPNADEIAHFPAGVSHWKYGRFDLYRVNPPLVRLIAVAPFVALGDDYDWTLYTENVGERPEFKIGIRQLYNHGLSATWRIQLSRCVAILFSCLGIWVLWQWGKTAVSRRFALAVVAFWCFCPNILAFASTINPDLGAVTMGLIAAYTVWRYLHHPVLWSVTIAGISLGLSLLTKLTWISATVSLPLAAWVSLSICRSFAAKPWYKRFLDLALYWGIALVTLNSGYLFERTMVPLGEYEFCSQVLGGPGCSSQNTGNRFQGTMLGQLPVPVPQNYLLGIDYLKYEVEQKKWSFLLGEWRLGSWPHYYVMTTALKTPESTLLGAFLGVFVFSVCASRRLVSDSAMSMFVLLCFPALCAFISVSYQGGFNHHHRYVLVIYPVIFAFAAYLVSPSALRLLRDTFPRSRGQHRRIATLLTAVLFAASVFSSLRVHPHYTSYFNSVSGGPTNGWRLLGFSNVDWGQDLAKVERWIQEHPECRPLSFELDFFGTNGELFKLPRSIPLQLPRGSSVDEIRKSITQTQWWIISVKSLHNVDDHNGLEYLQELEPYDRIAYSYHVYRIDPLPPETDSNK